MSDLERIAAVAKTPVQRHGMSLVSIRATGWNAFSFGFFAGLGAALASLIVGVVVAIVLFSLGAIGQAKIDREFKQMQQSVPVER